MSEQKGFFDEAPQKRSAKRLVAVLAFGAACAAMGLGFHAGWSAGEIAAGTGPFLTLSATLLVGGNFSERHGATPASR